MNNVSLVRIGRLSPSDSCGRPLPLLLRLCVDQMTENRVFRNCLFVRNSHPLIAERNSTFMKEFTVNMCTYINITEAYINGKYIKIKHTLITLTNMTLFMTP